MTGHEWYEPFPFLLGAWPCQTFFGRKARCEFPLISSFPFQLPSNGHWQNTSYSNSRLYRPDKNIRHYRQLMFNQNLSTEDDPALPYLDSLEITPGLPPGSPAALNWGRMYRENKRKLSLWQQKNSHSKRVLIVGPKGSGKHTDQVAV